MIRSKIRLDCEHGSGLHKTHKKHKKHGGLAIKLWSCQTFIWIYQMEIWICPIYQTTNGFNTQRLGPIQQKQIQATYTRLQGGVPTPKHQFGVFSEADRWMIL